MKIRNTFYDSVGGIASGEGLVHVEMLQRKDFNAEKKPESRLGTVDNDDHHFLKNASING